MNEITLAQSRAKRLYKSKNFQNAYMRGASAAINLRSINSCPYHATTTVSWHRAYRKAWLRGFQSVSTR